jgi:hypothetical protein
MRASRLRVLHLDRASAPAARNAGIDAARNEAIAFTDDDCMVAESWCRDLDRALNEDGMAAVAAPVAVAVTGPVTAFLNYQRYFDAPAIDPDEVRYVVTANCGFRRDLVPAVVRFDADTYNNASEDADFGYRLRDHGITLHWLGRLEPVTHLIGETINAIAERCVRYGRGSALLYRRGGRYRESVPGGHHWYADIAAGGHRDHRRFTEIVDPHLRAAFAVYNLLATASFLLGYLEGLSTEFAYPLIEVHHERLLAAWRQLGSEICSSLDAEATPQDLASPAVSFERFTAAPGRDRALRLVAPVLAAHTTVASAVPVEVEAELVETRVLFDAEVDAANQRAAEAWERVRDDAAGLTAAGMNELLRSAGTTFSDGCEEIEKLMSTTEHR